MSDTILDTPTRRTRADRPAREIHRESEPAVTIEGSVEQIAPEDALADSQRQLRERDTQLAQERQRSQEAEQRRQQAEAVAAQASQGRTQDRQAVVAAAIEASKAEQTQARTAYRLAREAGDVDAEVAASEALSSATYRHASATAELEYLKNQPKPAAPQPQQQQTDAPSAAAQKWLEEHPRFYSDDNYRAFAEGLHSAALRALGSQSNGSQQYIDFIESRMARQFGEGHGNGEGQAPVNGSGRQSHQPRGDGMPPSRQGGGSGGWKTIKTPLGEVQYQDRSDGTRGIRMSAAARENFEEGAKLDRNYDADPRQALALYTNEHITAALEGYSDLKVGDGRTYGGDEP